MIYIIRIYCWSYLYIFVYILIRQDDERSERTKLLNNNEIHRHIDDQINESIHLLLDIETNASQTAIKLNQQSNQMNSIKKNVEYKYIY